MKIPSLHLYMYKPESQSHLKYIIIGPLKIQDFLLSTNDPLPLKSNQMTLNDISD